MLLLEARRFPRDKSCGDGLTRPAVRLLEEMGVLPLLSQSTQVRGVRVFMRGHRPRDFEYSMPGGPEAHGLVVPRYVLDEAICRRAQEAGAQLWEEATVTGPLLEGQRVAGVRVRRAGRIAEVRAAVVVAADGARSRLARAVGMLAPDTAPLGIAIRGYLSGLDDLTDLLEIFLPLMDVTERFLLPSYGWVFPTGTETANVGVGCFERPPDSSLRQLLDGFVAGLRGTRGGVRPGPLNGGWMAAPLRFDFSPQRCVGPGVVLVGDAAGLVSPFTGEGISYALESGKIAADVIDRNLGPSGNLGSSGPDLRDYALRLEHAFAGYFETGRQSARRYQLVWRVLENTFDSDRPPFVLCRRAVLLPEGVGEVHLSRVIDDVAPLIAPGTNVRTDLLAVGEVMTAAVRREWPFLARLALPGQGDPGIPFRPALLLLLSSCFGDPTDPRLIDVGAAVELGYLAALAQFGVEDDVSGTDRAADGGMSQLVPDQPNWGNKFSILVGDFLLTKALQLSVQGGSTTLELISAAITSTCRGQVRQLSHAYDLGIGEAEHLRTIETKTAPMFELPCRLGAQLADADPAHVRALSRYGRHLGIAFQLTEDVLALTGEATTLRTSTGAGLREGVYPHPVHAALQRDPRGNLATILGRPTLQADDVAESLTLIRETGALAFTLQLAVDHTDRASQSLTSLPPGPARASLQALTNYVVTRKAPPKGDLLTLLE